MPLLVGNSQAAHCFSCWGWLEHVLSPGWRGESATTYITFCRSTSSAYTRVMDPMEHRAPLRERMSIDEAFVNGHCVMRPDSDIAP